MLLHKYGLVQKPIVAGFCYCILWPMGTGEKKILAPIHLHKPHVYVIFSYAATQQQQ
jgi:hypothetical protein